MKRPIARTVAACALLLSAAGAVLHTSAVAGSSVKTYRDSADHFTFQYPANWTLSTKLSDISGVAASFGVKNGVAVTPSDNAAFFAVLVRPSATALNASRQELR